MLWVFYSLLSAGFNGGKVAYDKNLLTGSGLSPVMIIFITMSVIAITLTPVAFLLDEQVYLSNHVFLKATLINVFLNAIAMPFFLFMLSRHDGSLITGIQSMEPLFVVGTAFFVLGETVSIYGLIGIVIVISGGFLLQKSRIKEDLVAILLYSPWVMVIAYMMLTSTATAYSKEAVIEGGVFIYLGLRYTCLALLFLFVIVFRRLSGKDKKEKYRFKMAYVGSGILSTLSVMFEMIALEMTKAAYVETIRRSSAFFTLVFESVFLKNKWNITRGFACFVMFIGAAIIVLSTGVL